MAIPTRVTVIGELNPFGVNPRLALYHLPRTSSGNRLRIIMGLSDVEYSKLRKLNLCIGKWDSVRAKACAFACIIGAKESSDTHDLLILLGSKVRDAFGVPNKEFWWEEQGGNTTLVTLPHPSGRNPVWNNPGAITKARKLLKQHAPLIPWGQDGAS